MRNIDMRDVHLSVDVGWDGTVEWTGTLRSSQQMIPLGAEAIQGALEDRPSILDDHGNDMAEIPVAITSSYPASISVRDLKVRYDHRVRFDATVPMMSTLSEARENEPDGSTALGISVEVGSSGRVILEDLNLTFYIDHKPFLIKPIPTQYMDEDIDAVRLVDLEEYFGDDWDDGRLTFAIVSSTDTAALEPRIEGRFLSLYTVADNWNGAVNVTVKAIDGAGLWNSSNTFIVVVRPINDPPVLNFIPDQEIEWGEDLEYVAMASDVDGDMLTFSDDTDLFDIEPASGLFSFKAKDKGEHIVKISVEDGNGGEDDQTVQFTVTPPPPDRPEVLTWDTECWSLIAIVALIAICLLIFFKYYRDHLAEPEVEKVSILKYGESQVTVEPPREDEVPDDYTPTDTEAIWDEAERYTQRKAVKLDKARMDKQGPAKGNMKVKGKGKRNGKGRTGTNAPAQLRPPQ
jgi:hypothetical protein